MTRDELNGWIEQIKTLDQEHEQANYAGFLQKKVKLGAVKSKYKLVQSSIKLHFDNMENDVKEDAIAVLQYLENTLNNM
ncbi:MAG: hypothetical protein LBH54_03570 [Clostridiales bacterium]|jgi:hypothetical protein|nr:hypothetical protein [Clostridiales bacterium]